MPIASAVPLLATETMTITSGEGINTPDVSSKTTDVIVTTTSVSPATSGAITVTPLVMATASVVTGKTPHVITITTETIVDVPEKEADKRKLTVQKTQRKYTMNCRL